jgi:hypothetical protein
MDNVKIQAMFQSLLSSCEKVQIEMDHSNRCQKNTSFHQPCNCGYDDFVKSVENIRYEYNNM